MTVWQFLRLCREIWLVRNQNGVHYRAICAYGIPQVTVLVGTGRNAWYVSNMAFEYVARKGSPVA